MDGRTVKEGTVGRGASFEIPRISCKTETSDGESSASPTPSIRDEDSHGGCATGVEGRLHGAMDGGRVELDSLKLNWAGSGKSGKPIGGADNENPRVNVCEGRVRTLRDPDVPARETESVSDSEGRNRRSGSYLHSSSLSLLTHVVQGRLASHFWSGEVSHCVPQVRLEYITTHCFPPPNRMRERGSH